MNRSITEISVIIEIPNVYSNYIFWEAVEGLSWGTMRGHFRKKSWSTTSLFQVFQFGLVFFQINKGGKQGKKFLGYKNNLYEGKQNAVKHQMFSKVEATGKLTITSICYKKDHRY